MAKSPKKRGLEKRAVAKEAHPRWAMLMPNLPSGATTQRVRIWRRLQAVGAVAVRPAVYVLPNEDQHVETLNWVAREIESLGGQASLCAGSFLDDATDSDIEHRMVEARAADYTALAEEARAVRKALSARKPPTEAALEQLVGKLRRRFDEVAAIDFLSAPSRQTAESLLVGLELELTRRASKSPRHRSTLEKMPRPVGATWVTRAGVHVDRIACAWLIRRFVDPTAKLKFVAPTGYRPAPGEVRFDMYDAELTHVGDRCSFEVILERMSVDDPALVAIGEIVHDLDVRDGKFGRAEAPGVAALITGVCATHRDDLDRIAAATPAFEALYACFDVRRRAKR